jgi:hypothetical protein
MYLYNLQQQKLRLEVNLSYSTFFGYDLLIIVSGKTLLQQRTSTPSKEKGKLASSLV